jgi:hypothetical protein
MDVMRPLTTRLSGLMMNALVAAVVLALVGSGSAVAGGGGDDTKPTEPEGATQTAPPPEQKEPTPDEEHVDETGHWVETGDFAKSIRIPGTSVSFKVGGYAKLDFIQDFDYVGNMDEFKTKTIPVEGDPNAELGGGNNIHARESRVNFDFRSKTPRGNFRAFVEADFYGDGNSLKLRHAYGTLGHLLGGHTWTTFMDISARPKTVDFEGADSSVFVRQGLIRWEQPIGGGFRWGIAVEDPDPQISNPTMFDGEVRSTVPDVVSRFRLDWDKGSHVQLAGIARQLRFDRLSSQGSDATATGWGVNFTGIWKLGKAKRDSFNWQVAFGRGVSRYIHAVDGEDYDAVLSPDGALQLVPSRNYVIGYRHFWTPTVRSGVIFAMAEFDNQPAQTSDAIRRVRSPHLNLFWSPWPQVDIGAEVMWGERVNKDGAKGTATRFHFAMKYKFN